MNNVNIKCQKEPYIPLKDLNLTLSRLLLCILFLLFSLVNNYEVNLIEDSYLILWGQDTSEPYIFVNQLLTHYPDQYYNLIKAFFRDSIIILIISLICIDYITYYDYYNFICFFLFFDINHIFLLLMSMCQIHSNYCISCNKVKDFLTMISGDNTNTFPDIFKYLDQYKIDVPDMQNNSYSIKSFIHYFTNCYTFEDYIYKLKKNIVKLTVSESNFNNIIQRQVYFKSKHCKEIKDQEEDSSNNEKDIMNSLHESCSSKIYRLLFTNAPPPNEYNYSFNNYTQDNFERVTLLLRQKYGYSYRISGCCEFRPRSSKQLHHYSFLSNKAVRIKSASSKVSFTSQTSLSPKCNISRYKVLPVSPVSCKISEDHISS